MMSFTLCGQIHEMHVGFLRNPPSKQDKPKPRQDFICIVCRCLVVNMPCLSHYSKPDSFNTNCISYTLFTGSTIVARLLPMDVPGRCGLAFILPPVTHQFCVAHEALGA